MGAGCWEWSVVSGQSQSQLGVGNWECSVGSLEWSVAVAVFRCLLSVLSLLPRIEGLKGLIVEQGMLNKEY